MNVRCDVCCEQFETGVIILKKEAFLVLNYSHSNNIFEQLCPGLITCIALCNMLIVCGGDTAGEM
jgi:hypothetical protein